MRDTQLDATASALQAVHATQKELFDTIDELRSLGVGRIVDLPQIVVVGDQSSGKSSVLEAISRVRFPVRGGLCTRFATELVLRTDPATQVHVSIERRSADLGTSLGEEKLSTTTSARTKDELPEIIEDAKRLMGIEAGSKDFSPDVLRVQILGPDVPNLTLVDLPGFYHSESREQSLEGRDVVVRLAKKYMEQKSSIILAVISARNDIVMQSVLTEVKKVDARKERTIGVITQPDRLEPGSSDEAKYLQIASNKEASQMLTNGWHLMKNRSEREAEWSDDERDAAEERFLSSGVWARIPPSNKGVGQLRKKLGDMLFTHIANSLPRVISDMKKSIEDRKSELVKLGDSRSSPGELRAYLERISREFSDCARDAVQGNYMSRPYFDDHCGDAAVLDPWRLRIRKLRSLVRDMNRAFIVVMYNKGAKWSIDWEDGSAMSLAAPKNAAGHVEAIIHEHYQVADPTCLPEEELKRRALDLTALNQGCEFPGEPNYRVTLHLFEDHAAPWRGIAERHIQLVTDTAKDFVEDLLEHVVSTDEEVRDRIMKDYINLFFEAKKAALNDKLEELLPNYRRLGYSLPLEEEFENRSRARYMERVDKQIRDAQNALRLDDDSRAVLQENQVFREAFNRYSSPSQQQACVDKMIDSMIAYYELSLAIFSQNVVVLAVENVLMSKIPEIFTTAQVVRMDDTTLESLAAEAPEISMRRQVLKEELEKLERGLHLCERLHRRKRPDSTIHRGDNLRAAMGLQFGSTPLRTPMRTPVRTPVKAPFLTPMTPESISAEE